jgi:hypothetical protein
LFKDLIAAVALRYGFRTTEFTAVWDGSEFDAERDPHLLVIAVSDGRQTTVKIADAAVGNPWQPLGAIEEAFRELQRRKHVRGE